MLYHSIINSEEERTAKHLVKEERKYNLEQCKEEMRDKNKYLNKLMKINGRGIYALNSAKEIKATHVGP